MNIFGINGGELIILVVLALLLLGPEKIPEYLRTLREWIHKIRVLADGAKEQFKEETGTDFDDVDWQKYDPRQYDPRRVIREALSEPIDDLEESLTDAKNTLQDATDTVMDRPERPQLSHSEIMAAAVPIDQLDQQPQLPDPSLPVPEHTAHSAALPSSADLSTDTVTTQAAGVETARLAAATGTPQDNEPKVLTTPFDSEAT